MKKKRKAKEKPVLVQKCWGCQGQLQDPDGFSARLNKVRVCVSCALKIVSTL